MNDEDEQLIVLLRDARTRDRAEPASALSARILADFDALSARRWRVTRLVDAVWPGAPLWKPAAALGLSLMIGLGVGALLPVYDSSGDSSIASDASPGLDFGGDLR
jgi:hypothetical protein